MHTIDVVEEPIHEPPTQPSPPQPCSPQRAPFSCISIFPYPLTHSERGILIDGLLLWSIFLLVAVLVQAWALVAVYLI